jgi:hypothetical protein
MRSRAGRAKRIRRDRLGVKREPCRDPTGSRAATRRRLALAEAIAQRRMRDAGQTLDRSP